MERRQRKSPGSGDGMGVRAGSKVCLERIGG